MEIEADDARVNGSDENVFEWEGDDVSKEIFVSYRFLINSKTIKNVKITGIKAKTYNGKVQTQSITVKDGTKTLKSGTATMTIKGKGEYSGTVNKIFKINKAANPMNVKAKKTVSAKAKAKSTIKGAVTVSKAQGKVTYTTNNKKVTVKNGTMTVSTGLKKGKTYSVKVTVTAKGNTNYKKLIKAVTIKVNVN